MQSFKNFIFKSSLLAIVFFTVVILITCSKPFEPVEPKDYPFYISAVNPSQIFVFHPTTNKLDSMSIPWFPYPGVTVSADGKTLYIAQGSSVVVVDTDSFSFIAELPYSQSYPVIISRDNQYLAITGNALYILRTSDYSLILSDTAQLLYVDGSFSSDSKAFYCASTTSQDSNNVVFRVDLSDSLFPVIRKGFADGSVIHIAPSLDDTKWFLYLAVGLWTSAFEVYDVAQDSITFRDILVPGAGDLAVSPDGKYVFYTSPGRDGSSPPPDLSFKIFDVLSTRIEAVVTHTSFFCFPMFCPAPKTLAVTPDGKWLVILGGHALLVPAFYLYDIQKSELVHRNGPDTLFRQLINLTVQNVK